MPETSPGEGVQLDTQTLALVFGVVFAGGVVTGVTGFGYAVVATATLASILDPGTAVVLVIIPLLAANVSLVRELDRDGLATCVRRFWPFVVAAAVGTILGMLVLARLPQTPLAVGLGVFTLAYVGLKQPWVAVPGERWLRAWCVRETAALKVVLGLASGVVFGASNVGVQVVAYLQRLDLDRETFVGVVAMVFLGVGLVRVLAAFGLGLYAGQGVLGVSLAAAVPGLLGVSVGARIRPHLRPAVQRVGVFGLLLVIGLKLVSAGL
jgi:hypothetical protein